VSARRVFTDWKALTVAAFAAEHQVNIPSDLYLPTGAIAPFPADGA
jgi:hypothetical protein